MQVVPDVTELIGYHGTDATIVDLIDKNSFKKSNHETDWFGTGCYFFTDGIGYLEPKEYAKLWVIDQAWDSKEKKYKYTKWVVLKTGFKIDNSEILDLRSEDGLKLFNEFRKKAISNILKENKITKASYKDQDVLDVMKKGIKLKVIIGNVYIKFSEVRMAGKGYFNSYIPNVTMFCIDNTEPENEYIELQNTVNIAMKGDITL